jgi:hypothetical protein
MSLATVTELQLYLQASGMKFSIGDDDYNTITTSDANSMLETELYKLRNWYEDDTDIESLPDDSWIKTTLKQLQCYMVLRSIIEVNNFDPTRLDVVNQAIDRLKSQLLKKQNTIISVSGGYSAPKL